MDAWIWWIVFGNAGLALGYFIGLCCCRWGEQSRLEEANKTIRLLEEKNCELQARLDSEAWRLSWAARRK